jgi:hypothetical protein
MEDAALDAGLLRRGRRFAGSGRVGPITVSPGRIAAVVEDPDGAYDVVVHLAQLTGAEWCRFLHQVRAEAGHLAALLDREVPRSLVRSADAADVPLLPTIGDLESACDCPEVGDPCQHAAALCYQTAWLLDDDPFVLLLLRGRDADELLDALARPSPAEPAGVPATGSGEIDRPALATDAYAAPPAPLPAGAAQPGRAGRPDGARPPGGTGPPDGTAQPRGAGRPGGVAFPAAPGLPPDALALLVADAAARARTLLQSGPEPTLSARADAARWAASHPGTAARVAAACRHDVGPGVRAWELGGVFGLVALEHVQRDPTAAEAAAEAAAPGPSGVRLRHGTDARWYPFRRLHGQWWPAGPPAPDPDTALDTALDAAPDAAPDVM